MNVDDCVGGTGIIQVLGIKSEGWVKQKKYGNAPTMGPEREDSNVYRKTQVPFTKTEVDSLEYYIILYYGSRNRLDAHTQLVFTQCSKQLAFSC